jgi:hypothetical protein
MAAWIKALARESSIGLLASEFSGKRKNCLERALKGTPRQFEKKK